MRSMTGAVLWVTGGTQLDEAFTTSQSQKRQAEPTVSTDTQKPIRRELANQARHERLLHIGLYLLWIAQFWLKAAQEKSIGAW